MSSPNAEISGSFTIDMHTIKNVDLEGGDWHPVLVAHLESDDFFFVKHFPAARVTITSAELVGDRGTEPNLRKGSPSRARQWAQAWIRQAREHVFQESLDANGEQQHHLWEVLRKSVSRDMQDSECQVEEDLNSQATQGVRLGIDRNP